IALQPALDLAQAGRPFQPSIQQRDELALGGQLPHPAIGPMRRHEPIKYIPRHLLQNLVKDAIVMLHGIAPLVSGSSPNVPNRVESMPCALSTKTQPDSRGLVPGIHVFGRLASQNRGWPGQARPWR